MSEQFQKTITQFIKAQQVQAQLQQDQLMKNQQEFLLLLSQNFKSSGVLPRTTEVSEEFRMETLSNGISEFHYDPENNVTFEVWYQRYESLFIEDAQQLSDPAKVRLLLRKLDTQVHQQYINLILPKETKEIDFKDTIAKLTEMFGKKTSVFNARYQCMKLTKNSSEDFVAYAAKVNKFCEDFDIRKITSDQFKCLIFVCRLQSGNDSDMRTKLLSKIDGKGSESLNLQDLTSECQRILNLKQDTAMIEHSNTSVVNAISKNKKYASAKRSHDSSKNNHKESTIHSHRDIPKTACWYCGQMHFSKNCTYRNHTCGDCRKVGHKEGYCGKNKRKNFKPFNRSNIICQVNSITERKYLQVIINGIQVNLQIDTASDITIVSEETWIKLGKPQCFPTENIVKNASESAAKVGLLRDSLRMRSINRLNRRNMAVNTILMDFSVNPNLAKNEKQMSVIATSLENILRDFLDNFKPMGSFELPDGSVKLYSSESGATTKLRIYNNGLLTVNIDYSVGDTMKSVLSYEKCKEIERDILDRVVEIRKAQSLAPLKRGTFMRYYISSDERLLEYDVDKILFEETSPYQKIQIVHSRSLGNMLVLDDLQNISESDLIYTETLMARGEEDYKNKEILILGGGDGALLYELLTENPKEVIMIEIDEVVMKACALYLKSICGNVLDKYTGERYKIIVGDCLPFLDQYIKEGRKFDYVFGDLTDVPISEKLSGQLWTFIEKVLTLSFKILKPDGKFMTHLNGCCCDESIETFKSLLKRLEPPVKFTTSEAFIPSFMEKWMFFQAYFDKNELME